MKSIKFIAMFAAAVAVGASFAGVDSYLYYMLDNNLTYSSLAGDTLSGQSVQGVDEGTYAMVSTDGGQNYLALYSPQGTDEGVELERGSFGYAGFSSEPSFTTFLFEVYNADGDKLGWTTLPYSTALASHHIYSDPSTAGGASVFHVSQLIPEPTSGLLFLFGAAGLALRRRRMARA